MRIDLIPVGANPPHSLNVIIEVPTGGEPVKYEFDKASGALFVDRILHTPMRYPANYGFVPHTLSPDGDPLDARARRICFTPTGLAWLEAFRDAVAQAEAEFRAEVGDAVAAVVSIGLETYGSGGTQ